MQEIWQWAAESANYISERITNEKPQLAVILGSGLGDLAYEVTERIEIPYSEIPHFPVSTVAGHRGKLIIGKIYDKSVIMMQGRFHYYEGYELSEVTFPIRVLALLGISSLIVSNAAGGINSKLKPTDIMLITDHINISNISPLRGPNDEEFGERFPNMTEAYSLRLREIAKDAANFKDEYISKINVKDRLMELAKNDEDIKIDLKEGVYAFMRGPQYETPAEIRMLDIIGADAVGMSTVPEVILANQLGIEVLGLSCITNSTGENFKPTHEEVIENADRVAEKFKQLVIRIIRKI